MYAYAEFKQLRLRLKVCVSTFICMRVQVELVRHKNKSFTELAKGICTLF